MQVTLGRSQTALGYPQKAVDLFIKSGDTFTTMLGPDHPDTLASMNNLACAYGAAGRPDGAILLHEQALAARKAKLGPDHPDTLIRMNKLATAYGAAGQFDLAVSLLQQLVDGARRREGQESLTYAGHLASLGRAQLERSKRSEAEPILRESLAIRESKQADD